MCVPRAGAGSATDMENVAMVACPIPPARTVTGYLSRRMPTASMASARSSARDWMSGSRGSFRAAFICDSSAELVRELLRDSVRERVRDHVHVARHRGPGLRLRVEPLRLELLDLLHVVRAVRR